MLSNFHPTSIDFIVFAVLLFSAIFGYWRGLVKEMFAIAGWLAAALALIYGFNILQPVARDIIRNPAAADFLTGTALFAGTLIIVSVITHFLSKWIKGSAFGGADKALGFVFGVARGALILALGFFLYSSAEPDFDQYPEPLQKSESLPYLQKFTDLVLNFVQNMQDSAQSDLENDDEEPISNPKDAAKSKELEYKKIEKEGLNPPAP